MPIHRWAPCFMPTSGAACAHLQDRHLVRQRRISPISRLTIPVFRSPIRPAPAFRRTHRGDYAIYAVADQMIWQDPDDPDTNQCLRAADDRRRSRIAISSISASTPASPFMSRSCIATTIRSASAWAYAQVSNGAAGVRPGTPHCIITGVFHPSASGETFVEVTYQYQVMPWWQIQPDFQYVFNPGAGIAIPNDPNAAREERSR